jgi:methionyl-tRNA formyltransferase
MTQRSCLFVGAESLLIQCAQIWARAGHAVAGIVSANPAIARHARQEGIAWWPDVPTWLASSSAASFDHLFAVTHLAVLPAEALARPKISAINFHDAPLPDYAGLNTPVWALLDGQTEHGVTWHLITAEVDRGDVLMQKRFALAENETALTLNTKCFEAGIETFEALVSGLTVGSLTAQAQTSAPLRMKLRKDRPAAAGALDWQRPAAELTRMVRALDFGSYANPVAAAKLLHDGGVLTVGAIEVTDIPSSQAPGTVGAGDEQSLTVATGDMDVRLSGLHSSCGHTPVHTIRAGQRLPLPNGPAIDAAVQATAAHEPFWLQRLETQTPLELPQIDRSASPQPARSAHLDVASPRAVAELAPDARLATLLAWMGRIADKDVFDIGWPANTALQVHEGLFAREIPLRAKLVFEQGLKANTDALALALADAPRWLSGRSGGPHAFLALAHGRARSPSVAGVGANGEPARRCARPCCE